MEDEELVRDPNQLALPDRLCVDPTSPFFSGPVLKKGIVCNFKGVDRTSSVFEFCVSEGWAKLVVPGKKDRKGNRLTIKANGPVEVRWR